MIQQHSSAVGVLALLHEPDAIFKQHALRALNTLVPQFWPEISEEIAIMFVTNVSMILNKLLLLHRNPV